MEFELCSKLELRRAIGATIKYYYSAQRIDPRRPLSLSSLLSSSSASTSASTSPLVFSHAIAVSLSSLELLRSRTAQRVQ
jgi:hypothetical protein